MPMPETLQDFKENPTAKLQALVCVLQHHISALGAKPLVNKLEYAFKQLAEFLPFPEVNIFVEEEGFWYQHHTGDGPNKIILFSYFPSNEHTLKAVHH